MRPSVVLTLAAGALVLGGWAAGPVAGQAPVLGRTDFPNSGPAAAQGAFLEGVLLLHSFEYERAARAFREAQRMAPDFALAYWGEAMTHNHPVWFRQDRSAALEVLGRLGSTPEERRARATTERERAWLESLDVLYGGGPKARRDTLYAETLGGMHARWPDDENMAAFYAVAILGTSHGGRDVPTYMRAGAVAEGVYERNPEHPGALHYLIHSYDDPVHAPLGLRAARRYSQIAGDAPHAQHMTTHIFVAMGMWDDVVAQNEVAAGPDRTAWRPGHYTWWLGYGYLQQGRHARALEHLEALRAGVDGGAPSSATFTLARMRAELVANTGDWRHAVLDWPIDVGDVSSGFAASLVAADDYVRGRAALAGGDTRGAARAVSALARRAQDAEAAGDPNDPTPGVARVMALQLMGLVDRQEGRADEGLARLREALALEESLPYEFGPPLVVVPSGELLGTVLLDEGRHDEAMAAFRATLAVAPGRASSLLGLARAAEGAGNHNAAHQAWSRLLDNWHAADDGIAGLAEARRGRDRDAGTGGSPWS
jgi:tetratricopeptide (TPR) repeat protein